MGLGFRQVWVRDTALAIAVGLSAAIAVSVIVDVLAAVLP